MYRRELEVRERLESLKEEKYKKFSQALIPGCDNLIGVRIPTIRKIAKEIAKDNPVEYLEKANDIYFEETMLKGLIIGNLKGDIEEILDQVAKFVPKITNWSLCDSFCTELKIVRKHKERVWDFIMPYYNSDQCYHIRFAVVMMLFHYIEEEYIDDILKICDGVKHEDYYVKMGVAWTISICFVKFPEKTMNYLKDNKLDDETYNKSLQKIRESLRVDKSTKEVIKSMRRK